ncbi:TPA: hypothetical protein EYO12_03445 [Candidatus Saccharibacteria bacterium]|nr:hypothetical protein [Candidatus Saccharibacteria bacterium]HIO87913.1 hypothetical protein [Candidatus Saccharibacteria bacterium]
MSTIFWLCTSVTALSAVISSGFSLQALLQSRKTDPVNAMYAYSRSLALALVGLSLFIVRSEEYLVAVAVTMIFVQAFDFLIGIQLKDVPRAVGPLTLAITNLVLVILL